MAASQEQAFRHSQPPSATRRKPADTRRHAWVDLRPARKIFCYHFAHASRRRSLSPAHFDGGRCLLHTSISSPIIAELPHYAAPFISTSRTAWHYLERHMRMPISTLHASGAPITLRTISLMGSATCHIADARSFLFFSPKRDMTF